MTTCTRRIAIELSRIQKNPNNAFEVICNETNMHLWTVIINGEKGTIYEGYKLKTEVAFGIEYPFRPPIITFKTNVFHPNISAKGEVCNNLLNSDWNASISIKLLIENIINMLACPNVEDPLNIDAANLYKTNREEYNIRVVRALANNK